MMWNKRIHFQPTSDMCLFDEYKLEFMLVKAVDLSPPPQGDQLWTLSFMSNKFSEDDCFANKWGRRPSLFAFALIFHCNIRPLLDDIK